MDVVTAHWSASWVFLACYLLVAAAHLVGIRRLLVGGAPEAVRAGGDATAQQLKREALLFQFGLLATLLAVVSPVGYWSDVYIWVRAMQALVLAFFGPALIVAGAPWPALRQVLPRAGRPQGGPDLPDRAAARVPRLLRYPVAVVVAFNVIWLAWELPAAFDAVRGDSALAFVEHATLVAAGIMLWLQLIGSRPWSPAASPLRRAAMIVGTVGAGTVLGMVLVFGNGVLYPVYAGPAHHVMTVLDDQQLAGAVLWMGMLPVMIGGAVAVMMKWLSEEESAELSASLDRLLSPRKSSWPSRPGIR